MEPLTLAEASEIIHSLGFARKMPCKVWSVPAKNCNRGSKLNKIKGTVCNKCYALRGHFARPTIQAGLQARQDAMEHPRWSEAMAIVLTAYETSGFFRWYAAGDIHKLVDLIKISDVCNRTPHIKHWLPTHEVGLLGDFRRAGFQWPKNLTVRLSADFIDKPNNRAVLKRLGVVSGEVSRDHNKVTCVAYQQDGMCQTCRACWHRSVPIVTYPLH